MNSLIEKYNVEKKDVPKVFVTFKVISTVSYIGTLALCYRYRPFSKFFKSQSGIKFNGYLLNTFPKMYTKIMDTKKNLVIKAENNKYIRKIPEAIGLKTSRFTKAFIENFLFYKLTLPITLPVYIYFSVKYVKARKNKKAELKNDETIEE